MLTIKENISYSTGFTLIELLITIVIVGLIASIGIPSFTQTIRNSRLTTNINELVTSLNFARSEAVKRNQAVTIRKFGAEWETGWTVFVDVDGDGDGIPEGDAGDTVLRRYGAMPNNFTLRSTAVNRLTYRASGISATGSFVLCENSDGNNVPEANTSRLVIINNVGRVRMGSDNNNNGIPEETDGTEITSCTVPFS